MLGLACKLAVAKISGQSVATQWPTRHVYCAVVDVQQSAVSIEKMGSVE